MTFAIAAAGTGGHVYPGLSVGEALVDAGVDRTEIVYIGGDRLEARVYPDAGFPFEQIEMRGFARKAVRRNLGLPSMVVTATRRAGRIFDARRVSAVLGFGNYITIPVALAARRRRLPFFIHEQNALPGVANRVVSRLARHSFVSFPDTPNLARTQVTGNPIRAQLAAFDRSALRGVALERYALDPDAITLGVVGGSLGAGAINDAVIELVRTWEGPPLQLVHLAGTAHVESINSVARQTTLTWNVIGHEDRMDLFFAATDLVVARSGGSVAELLATGTPSIVVPGGFGSGGHQHANAQALADAGAAVLLSEDALDSLPDTVADLVGSPDRRHEMAVRATALARPEAAADIAAALMEAAGG